MNKRVLIGYLLLAVIMLLTCVYLAARPGLLDVFSRLSVAGLAWVFLWKLAVAWLNAEKFRQLSKLFGLPLRIIEWFGLTAVTTFYSYFMPARSNIAPRAWYLKKKYDFDYLLQVPLLVGASIIDLAVNLSLLTACTVFLLIDPSMIQNNVAMVLIAILVLCFLIVVLFRLPESKHGGFMARHLQRLRIGFYAYVHEPARTFTYALVCAASLITRAAALWVCFFALGTVLNPMLALAATAVASITVPVSVVPGNIGVTEAALVLVITAGGVQPADAIAPVLLSRAGSIVVQFGLGIIFSYLLFGRIPPANPSHDKRGGDK